MTRNPPVSRKTVAMTVDSGEQLTTPAPPPVYTPTDPSVAGSDHGGLPHRLAPSQVHRSPINPSSYPTDNKQDIPAATNEPKVLMTPELQASSARSLFMAGSNHGSLLCGAVQPSSPPNPLGYPGDHKIQIPEYDEDNKPSDPFTPSKPLANTASPELDDKSRAPVTSSTPLFNTAELPASPSQVPSSNDMKSHTNIVLTGPLDIRGKVSSSSSINLSRQIHVWGKTHSSGSTQLSGYVTVDQKVEASGSIKCWDHVVVLGKVSASGSVELRDEVDVGEKVDCSGSITLKNGVRVGDKVDASGSLTMDTNITVQGKASSSGSMTLKNGISIAGDTSSSGKMKLEGPGGVTFGGKVTCSHGMIVATNTVSEVKDAKFTVRGSLELSATLHIKGDLEVSGNLTLRRGANLVVDGNRKIHGKVLRPDGPADEN